MKKKIDIATIMTTACLAVSVGCTRKAEVTIKVEDAKGGKSVIVPVPAASAERTPAQTGDPSLRPGMRGGPCVDENCGHPDCDAARKWVEDHECVICKKPLGWGKVCLALHAEGKENIGANDPDAQWFHMDCANGAQCAVCDRRLGISRRFVIVDGKPVHEECVAEEDQEAR